MSKFCKKCGTQIADEIEFCPKCGTPQNKSITKKEKAAPVKKESGGAYSNSIPVTNESSKTVSTYLIGVVAALVMVIGAFFIVFHGDVGEVKALFSSNVATNEEAKPTEPDNKNNDTSKEKQEKSSNPHLQNAIDILAKAGIKDVKSTSYGHSEKGFLAQLSDGSIVLYDKINNRVAKVSPSDVIKQIAEYKNSSKKTIKMDLLINNDSRDADVENGSWSGNNHLLPVTVEFNYENGTHKPYMIKSGKGSSPGSYDNYLYETKNVDIVNMVVEEASFLK